LHPIGITKEDVIAAIKDADTAVAGRLSAGATAQRPATRADA
jgi:hypothetical protein